MPDKPRLEAELREKMFISFSGAWGNEKLGGFIQKLNSNVVILDPVIIDELPEEKEHLEMEASDLDYDMEEPIRRLPSGGIEVSLASIDNIYGILLPYPQKVEQYCY